MRRLAIAFALFVAACSSPAQTIDDAALDDGANGIDAPPPGPCWPDTPPPQSATATIEIMTGPDGATYPLAFGIQDGYNFDIPIRATGIAPGNPNSTIDPTNPRTRVLAYFDATNVPLNRYTPCALDYGYKPVDADTYEMAATAFVLFETCWRASNLVGQRIRIEAEIIDSAGTYAKSTSIVIAGPASNGPVPDDGPGCPTTAESTHRSILSPT